MKKIFLPLLLFLFLSALSCKKEKDQIFTPYELLTTRLWSSDSLLVDGENAGGPGQLLETFNGDAEFRADGTGVLGQYTATWSLSPDNTEITIKTDDPPMEFLATIKELTTESLKISTAIPSVQDPNLFMEIRMTFKAKF